MGFLQRLGSAFSAIIAFLVGVITLVSLLLGGNPGLFGDLPQAADLAALLALPAAVLLRLVALVIALGVLIGIANLLLTHAQRLMRGRALSAALLGSFALTLFWYVARAGDTSLLEAVQLPIESSLAALLCLTLVGGAARVIAKRADIWSLLFVLSLLIVLLASLPWAELEPLRAWRDWLLRVPVSAGTRALLLGIALATVVAGVRIALGQDRAYRG